MAAAAGHCVASPQAKSRRVPGRSTAQAAAHAANGAAKGRAHRSPAAEPAPDRRIVWFFDLDNTLHDASHAIFRAIDSRMTAYVQQHLEVDRAEADRLRRHYWLRYGATLLGLVRHHGVDPHHFLRETHDFEVVDLLRAERGLGRLFARLPGRKILLTNAPARYADAVLRALAIHRHLGARYTIETMRLHGAFRPKPSRSMLRHMLARERVPAGKAVLIEDSIANLRAARAVGFRTVLVCGHSRLSRSHGSHIGLRMRSVLELPRARMRLRR
jgi:putative hydrolase of the HAD superfamily